MGSLAVTSSSALFGCGHCGRDGGAYVGSSTHARILGKASFHEAFHRKSSVQILVHIFMLLVTYPRFSGCLVLSAFPQVPASIRGVQRGKAIIRLRRERVHESHLPPRLGYFLGLDGFLGAPTAKPSKQPQ